MQLHSRRRHRATCTCKVRRQLRSPKPFPRGRAKATYGSPDIIAGTVIATCGFRVIGRSMRGHGVQVIGVTRRIADGTGYPVIGARLSGYAFRKEFGVSDAATTKIAELLHQAGEVHHMVFADTDGNDDDWATFYSDWLLAHSDLSKLLARRPVRSPISRETSWSSTSSTRRRNRRSRGRTGMRSASSRNTELHERRTRVRNATERRALREAERTVELIRSRKPLIRIQNDA